MSESKVIRLGRLAKPLLLVRSLDTKRASELARQWLDALTAPFTLLIDDAKLTAPNAKDDNLIDHDSFWENMNGILGEADASVVAMIAHPMADALALADLFGCPNHPRMGVRLDCVTSIVDAKKLVDAYDLSRLNVIDDDADHVTNLVEWADVVILDGVENLSKSAQKRALGLVRAISPGVKILNLPLAQDDLKLLFNSNQYGDATTSDRALIGSLRKAAEKKPETTEFTPGLNAVLYRRKRPFHPQKLEKLLSYWPESILRSNGPVWVATRNHTVLELNQCGRSGFFLDNAGNWLTSQERGLLTTDEAHLWDNVHADRHTELVILGEPEDIEMLPRLLDECLLTDLEMRMDWGRFKDTLPTSGGSYPDTWN